MCFVAGSVILHILICRWLIGTRFGPEAPQRTGRRPLRLVATKAKLGPGEGEERSLPDRGRSCGLRTPIDNSAAAARCVNSAPRSRRPRALHPPGAPGPLYLGTALLRSPERRVEVDEPSPSGRDSPHWRAHTASRHGAGQLGQRLSTQTLVIGPAAIWAGHFGPALSDNVSRFCCTARPLTRGAS